MTTWMDKGIRDEVDMAQFAPSQAVPADLAPTTFAKLAMMLPDPRDLTIAALRESLEAAHRFGIANHERAARADARIAELEAALREVRKLADVNDGRTDWKRLQDAGQIARTALMPSPERDMKMAQEELSA